MLDNYLKQVWNNERVEANMTFAQSTLAQLHKARSTSWLRIYDTVMMCRLERLKKITTNLSMIWTFCQWINDRKQKLLNSTLFHSRTGLMMPAKVGSKRKKGCKRTDNTERSWFLLAWNCWTKWSFWHGWMRIMRCGWLGSCSNEMAPTKESCSSNTNFQHSSHDNNVSLSLH